jgi:hypothetical protein
MLALGRPLDAQADIAKALELDPKSFAVNQKAGELSLRLGVLDTAADQFLAAVRAARPGSPDELAAASALALVRKRQRSSISHHAVLPRLSVGRTRALRSRWLGLLRRSSAG